jgi:hypothetical protein
MTQTSNTFDYEALRAAAMAGVLGNVRTFLGEGTECSPQMDIARARVRRSLNGDITGWMRHLVRAAVDIVSRRSRRPADPQPCP